MKKNFNNDLEARLSQATAFINKEFIAKKIDEIKEFRKRLNTVRKNVSDQYAENIAASNMTCNTQ